MEYVNGLPTYEQFERDWLRRHKGSIVSKPRISSWGLIFNTGLWIVIMTGAAVYSGTHTVPAAAQTISHYVPSPLRDYLSLSIFTILELTIFAGSLNRRNNRTAFTLMVLAMVGALAANIGSSVQAVTDSGGDWLIMVVSIVLALLAPSVALGAGEMSHRLYEQHQQKITSAMEMWETKRKELDAIINREYTKLEKQIRELSGRTRTPQLSALSVADGQRTDSGHGYGSGYSKRTDADTAVRTYLAEHPEDMNMNVRDLAAKIGVGKTKVAEVVRELKLTATPATEEDTEPVEVAV